MPPAWVVLLNPGVEVSARDAYLWLDKSGKYTPPLDVPALLSALQTGAALPYFNALQGAVAARHPEVETALSALAEAGLHSPLMSGSGSTVFGLARTQAQAAAPPLRCNGAFRRGGRGRRRCGLRVGR